MAAEKLKPRPSPLWSPTTPNRFGPTRLGPPFSKVWQAAHFLAAAAPFSTDAVCSNFSIGSDGAAASLAPPSWASSFTAISKPGFSGITGEKIAPAAKLVTKSTMQVPRMAPITLLSSKESIADQAPEPEGRLKAGKTAADSHQESGFRAAPSAGLRYRFARALATRINAPTFRQSPLFPACFYAAPDRAPMTETRTLVLIPARMAATRLPGKPLLDIAGLPMIVHVLRRAEAAKIGRVAVATDTPEIAAVVKSHGGEVVMTRADHPSGSDRIYEALGKLDSKGQIEAIINLQGDLPTIPSHDIRAALMLLEDSRVDIGTLAAEIRKDEEHATPNVVKVVGSPLGRQRLRALYFTRATAPYGDGPRYHHIGLYAYRREALERYVKLPPSVLEKREKLEQLRALEAGMRIDAAIVDSVPLGVDTPADLETARHILAKA